MFMRTFGSPRTRNFRQANTSIDDVTPKSDETQLDIFIRNTEDFPRFNGFFTNDLLASMVEAAETKTCAFYDLPLVHYYISYAVNRTIVQFETFSPNRWAL